MAPRKRKHIRSADGGTLPEGQLPDNLLHGIIPIEYESYGSDASDFYEFNDIIAIKDPVAASYAKLYFAIVRQAYIDYHGKSLTKKIEARKWVFSNNDCEWSFTWICREALECAWLIRAMRKSMCDS